MPDINYEKDAIASLDISISHDDSVYVSMWHSPMDEAWLSDEPPPPPESWNQDWASILATATGCTADELTVEKINGYLSVEGTCSAIEPTSARNVQWSGEVDLLPLVDALAAIDVDYLTVWLSVPQIGATEQTEGSRQSQYEPDGLLFQLVNRFVPSELVYDIEIANPDITQISYSYGFSSQRIVLYSVILISIVLLPLVVAFWLRSRALRLHKQTPDTPIWFGYQRSLQWLLIAFWIMWSATAFTTELTTWLPALLLPKLGSDWIAPLSLVLFLVPPSLVEIAVGAISYPVTKTVGQLDYSKTESLALAAAGKGVIICPLAIFNLAWPMFKGDPIALGCGMIAGIGMAGSFLVLQKFRDWTPQAITTGELRDRIFQLAKPTGIELKQIYLLPMKRSRMVNAFALKNNTVMVTDYLLRQLSKAEVDAIMAHELAHLQLGHPTKLLVGFLVLLGLAFWVVPLFLAFLVFLIPYSFIFQLLLSAAIFYGAYYSTSRRFEYQADAQAALLTHNPQALITGLVKIAHLNQMPLQWGKWGEKMMTHPSMQRRVEAIAKRYDISPTEMDSLIQQATIKREPIDGELMSSESPDCERTDYEQTDYEQTDAQQTNKPIADDSYDVDELLSNRKASSTAPNQAPSDFFDADATVTGQAPLFSTQFKEKITLRYAWLLWLCFGLGAVIVGRLAELLPTPGLRWLGYGGGAIAILALYFYLLNTAPAHGYIPLGEQLAQRLKAEGFALDKGAFVGFAPSDQLVNYEGHSVWDIGWLQLSGNQLVYLGERLRFALTTHQITHIELKKENTLLIATYALSIVWQDNDLSSHTFKLQPLGICSLRQLKASTQGLRHELDDWHVGKCEPQPDHEHLQSLQPPALGEITSSPPSKLTFRFAFITWLSFVLIAFAIAAITNSLTISPALTAFILTLPTLGALFQLWPALKRRLRPSS